MEHFDVQSFEKLQRRRERWKRLYRGPWFVSLLTNDFNKLIREKICYESGSMPSLGEVVRFLLGLKCSYILRSQSVSDHSLADSKSIKSQITCNSEKRKLLSTQTSSVRHDLMRHVS